MKIKKDKFVSQHLKLNSYLFNFANNKNFDQIYKLTKPYFLTLKSNFALNLNHKKSKNLYFICKHLTFCKKIKYKKLKINKNYCVNAKKSDLPKLKEICLENTSNSHFVQDNNLPRKFKKNFRYHWLKNFFDNKRGDYLIIYKNKIIKGFILLIKNKNKYIIDLIVIKKK